MNWKHVFTTSIGKKLQMSLTGLFLILFLIVHCYINAQIFWNDGGAKFEEAAHFMGTNFIIRTIELGLAAFLLLHIFQGLNLWFQNMGKRSVKYAVKRSSETSAWYRRSMGILGSLLLIFLVIHTAKFWIPNRASQIAGNGELPLYEMMKEEFQITWVVVVYIIGCITLAWHLVHGFWSSFQTLGLSTHRYKQMINGIGVAFAIIVPLVFALMPLAFYFHWID